jgi:hypothetical protein
MSEVYQRRFGYQTIVQWIRKLGDQVLELQRFSRELQLSAWILSGKASKKDKVLQQKLGNITAFCCSPALLLEISMPLVVNAKH